MGKRKTLVIGGIVGGYILHFPLRLLEDWVMGEIGGMIAENWQFGLSFFIAWALPFIIVFGAIWLGYKLKSSEKGFKGKTAITQKDTGNGLTLTEILTEMHEQMMYLKTVRLKRRFNKKQFEDAAPLFFDKLGLIKLSDWDTYEKKIAKRIKHRIPKSPEKQAKTGWRYKVIGEAKEMVRELVSSKEWQIEDVVKAGEHLDSLHIGLGELRDKDEKWQELFEKTKPYMNDPILRTLIDKHVSYSYAFCSALLEISYGGRLSQNSFSQLLYSALVGGNIGQNKIEVELSEILEQIEDRLKVFKQRPPSDSEVNDAIQLLESETLVITPHTYAIGLSSMTGYPDEPDNADWLCLEVAVNPINKPIDTLDLLIDSETIPANHWPGKNVAAFNVYFNVTLWRRKGKKQVELIAYVGNKMYRSGRMNIDFNVEAWGSHRI